MKKRVNFFLLLIVVATVGLGVGGRIGHPGGVMIFNNGDC